MKRIDFLKLAGIGGLGMSLMSLNGMSAILDALPGERQRMPVLFAGHGSPMIALEDNGLTRKLGEIGKGLPRPRAILCISAHWITKGSFVSTSPSPAMIYDMYGFPDALYRVQYPAPGFPEGGEEVIQTLGKDLIHPDNEWGFDHGNWTIMKHLFPKADIPVFQMSIDYEKPMEYHFELASRLKPLRDKGILIIGSGNITHNLRELDFSDVNARPFDWAREFDEKIKSSLDSGNAQGLIRYQEAGSSARLAVPEPSHYFPLVYTAGLRDTNEEAVYFNDVFQYGSLSMRSVVFGG